jgi:YVTN family beta-propeller protein
MPRGFCGRRFSFFAAGILLIAAAVGSPVHAQTVTVGTGPEAIAVNPVTNTIYVVNSNSDNVTVINGATNATATVAVGEYPLSIAVNPVTNKIYVANSFGSSVTVIDGTTNATVTVPAGPNALSVAVNPVTDKIYVANGNSGGTVTVIDGATNATTTVPVGSGADAVAVNSVTNQIYVADDEDRNITVIDGSTNATTTVAVASSAATIAVNSVTDQIYVGSTPVTVIDGATNATTTVASPSGYITLALAVNSVTDTIYVTNVVNSSAALTAESNMTVIDGSTNATTTVPVGIYPYAVAVDSVTDQIYVANEFGNNVTVIDGTTNATTTDAAGTNPYGIAVNPVTNKFYVTNSGDGTVAVIVGAAGTSTPPPTPTPTPPGGGGGGGGGSNGSARLINISTRAEVGTGANILIPGFVIGGSGTETLLIRADGPALTGFGVAGALAQPSLSVFNSAGTVVASNTGWGTNTNPAQIVSAAASVGAFALASGSADCAVLASLSPGAYTVQVSGVGNSTGVALAEVYEVSTTGTRLANISTRALVGTGANIIIPGFVIAGSGSEQLLARGDGPALTGFGVSGALAQPSLSVFDSSGAVIASNTGWGTGTNPAQITSAGASVGAFALASGSADSALIVNVSAGAYTMQLSGVSNSTGVALAEVYEVP